ncbi:hypothetical protein GUJ93_ZPchr0006g45878 [Zizania palustris]|uniref:Dof zinc finger protein n=1 Tax=Zizania palustris TaxID=103762 RepID=A0A8J5SUL0_ZIZPA|nr:hypothetical protein GUJ93_ZPchr0006g45878 [Zizania palustris]
MPCSPGSIGARALSTDPAPIECDLPAPAQAQAQAQQPPPSWRRGSGAACVSPAVATRAPFARADGTLVVRRGDWQELLARIERLGFFLACMDAAHWHQGLGLVKPMEEMLMGANPNHNPSSNPPPQPPPPPPAAGTQRAAAPPAAGSAGAGAGGGAGAGASTERRARPQKEKALNCPRCNSTNTKFCYYNNYSLQQPRYFCKTCRRYWTEGGSLRNVPVGGGSRKNKRSSSVVSSASASASTSAAVSGTVPVGLSAKNPKLMHEGAQDLNLAYPHHHGRGLQPPEFAAFPSLESSSLCNPGGNMAANGAGGRGSLGAFSAMELLRSTGCYVPLPTMPLGMPADYSAAGFTLGDFRMPPPSQQQHHAQSLLGFSLDTHGSGGGTGSGVYGGCSAGMQGGQDSGAGSRLLFPFEDLKPMVSSAAGDANNGGDHHQFDHSKDQGGGVGGVIGGHETPGFWNSNMIGNGNSNGGGGGGGGGGSW